MSIEDINYMKENSIKQAYTFIIDSSDRDRNMYPNPNNYVVNFSTPFKNIIGMEIIDASIPRAMYTIDVDNNELYYYIGNDVDDEIIADGIQISNSADLMLRNGAAIANSSNLQLSGGGYAILSNSINIYNIYRANALATSASAVAKNSTIGGTTLGLTFNLSVKLTIADNNVKCNIIDFSYNHVYTINNIFNNINIQIEKDPQEDAAEDLYILTFTIGTRIIDIPIYNFDITTNYLNIYWSILNRTWYIGTFDENSNVISYDVFNNCDEIKNVFYTRKYIGKKYEAESNWNNSNILLLKDFKIYNVAMASSNVMLDSIDTIDSIDSIDNNINLPSPPATLPIWYKMKDITEYNTIINDGYNSSIDYKDIFKYIYISPGDYTFKTFITKYNELVQNNDLEIMFSETTTPPELSNLIDIFSKAPLIVDMKRTTLSENLGFDLYPTANNEDRYISKSSPSLAIDSVLAKMFYSRLNNNYNPNVTTDNKWIITSPGIVYFIGNKYIIMRCPEIEEHLYRSLSYSKYTLGLAKFRVDSVGINSEKLTITKIPVREFHPIGKLSRMTLRFETNKGSLYDFKGINHNIIFAIFYYEPIQKNVPTRSILNPEYKMNYIDYLYKQEEIEGDSDDDEDNNEDYSRDNIDDYKTKEKQYSENGVKLMQFNNYFQGNTEDAGVVEDEGEDEDEEADEGDGNEEDEGEDGDDSDTAY
jgi:hypothetical protein